MSTLTFTDRSAKNSIGCSSLRLSVCRRSNVSAPYKVNAANIAVSAATTEVNDLSPCCMLPPTQNQERPVGQKDRKGAVFSIFRTASEEAVMKEEAAAKRAAEGGHMSCKSGRIVCSPGAGLPFTAVMTREDDTTFEVGFQTMSAAEAFIRRNTPSPEERSTAYDHDPW